MAGRDAGPLGEAYRLANGVFGRMRLRDILAAPFGQRAGAAAAPTIGDVFTSERAVALLVRWHIKLPSNGVRNEQGQALLHDALTAAQAAAPRAVDQDGDAGWDADPARWGDDHEDALLDALEAAADAADRDAWWNHVRRWPTWWPVDDDGGNDPRGYALDPSDLPEDERELRTGRGSFALDDGGLPPAPAWNQ